jgi:hypothetical protein
MSLGTVEFTLLVLLFLGILSIPIIILLREWLKSKKV